MIDTSRFFEILAQPAAAPALPALAAIAASLAGLRRRRIIQITGSGPRNAELRRAALTLRKVARGPKLTRRLRRKAQLGMAGAF